jgi:spore coat polysaccharide biosynthesis protein SpsF
VRKFQTPQEQFWASEFGNEYANRNEGDQWIANNTAFFAKIFTRTESVHSVIEFGANIGLNLRAIRHFMPRVELSAVEINDKAVSELRLWGELKNIYPVSILDFEPSETVDFALTKGVLIHINPDMLPQVYEKLYRVSRKYICVAEYYNPTPMTVQYRGHEDRLFKRDFAGEILDKYPDLKLTDYGFAYHRDPNHPQGDITWFLLEKASG